MRRVTNVCNIDNAATLEKPKGKQMVFHVT